MFQKKLNPQNLHTRYARVRSLIMSDGTPQGNPGGAVAKHPPANARDAGDAGFDPWVGKITWRKKWQPTPVFLPGESHGQRSLVGYSSQGRKEYTHTGLLRVQHLPLSSPTSLASLD